MWRVEYFIALCELPLPQLADVDHAEIRSSLRALYRDFAPATTHERVKEIESGHQPRRESRRVHPQGKNGQRWDWGHTRSSSTFGLTSQDINNTAIPLNGNQGSASWQGSSLPGRRRGARQTGSTSFAEEWRDVPMLAKHPRAAGLADDAGQGVQSLRRPRGETARTCCTATPSAAASSAAQQATSTPTGHSLPAVQDWRSLRQEIRGRQRWGI
jgi:hypothetical protein